MFKWLSHQALPGRVIGEETPTPGTVQHSNTTVDIPKGMCLTCFSKESGAKRIASKGGDEPQVVFHLFTKAVMKTDHQGGFLCFLRGSRGCHVKQNN